jgi:hypothetical protein
VGVPFKALPTDRETIGSTIWNGSVVSPSGKPSIGLIVAIRWLESFESHLTQPSDTDIGLLADARE